ncbi:GSK family serine/threonine-protein kinase Ecym_6056 [Eremothecium cymbalariae DBVPG|uniref:non-specific serine/threonine protein kinase n=1 Tax=Eremothecium cymbalariae (strain CBS 270.75 / DBVPG 7215 / KCTC 17166 / NRRL Y-17582) TaxID=931890 RepID=G8JUY0_ERECY|nr:hypothetical protein Ecym_6056 [Eremothecium cymbalariae DBVPG\
MQQSEVRDGQQQQQHAETMDITHITNPTVTKQVYKGHSRRTGAGAANSNNHHGNRTGNNENHSHNSNIHIYNNGKGNNNNNNSNNSNSNNNGSSNGGQESGGGAETQTEAEEELVEITYPATEVVGHGSFGVVFTTVIEQTGEKVAIKKVLQDKRFKNRELEIMKLLEHVNVVDLRYHFYESEPQTNEVYLNLILEYMPQSLYQRLRHFVTSRTLMPRDEIKVYMFQLFKSLNYLHRVARVCHRDIKPQNLLVDAESLQLKLCDFGSAKQLKPTEPNVSYICSRYYRAPELIFGATNYTTQIDIWSTGCVMAELLLGQPMFPGESGIDQLVEIIKILGTPTRPEICAMNENYSDHKFPQIKPIPLSKVFKREDPETVQLLNDVLQYDPTKRFNALLALCSSYFDDITCLARGDTETTTTTTTTTASGARGGASNAPAELWQGICHNLQLMQFAADEFNDLNDLEKSLVQSKLILHTRSD